MKPHNIMEDLVVQTVEELFENPSLVNRTGCVDNRQCRTDVVCYVLNRLKPMYTTSGRGLTHIEKSYLEKPQIVADITALANEGLRQVGTHMRPEDTAINDIHEFSQKFFFNFPIIKGKVYNGKTFAPYFGSEVKLFLNNNPAKMRDKSWQNPCPLVSETDGIFMFWPFPEEAENMGNEQTFSFRIEIEADGFKPVKHFFSMEITAEDAFVDAMEIDCIHKLDDIYLFPADEPEEIGL